MSLISDALKTISRERSGQAQSARQPQPIVDGFFPYVSSTPAPRRNRRHVLGWTLGIAGVAIVAAGMVWALMSASLREPTGTAPKPRIILPPPVSTAQAPIKTDTAVVEPGSPVMAVDAAGAQASNGDAPRSTPSTTRGTAIREAARPTSQPADRTPVASADPLPTTSVVASVPAPATPARIDYEAQATAAFNAGDLVGAREKFQLATRYAPTARAWTNYGVTLQRLGDNAGASSAYQSAIGVDANYLEAWLYQGRLVAALGDIGRAIPLFQRARAINPRNAEVNVELARLEYDARNFTDARRFAEEATRADQANYRGHWYVAVASDQLKDAETALRAYTAYLRTVGDDEREQAQFVGFARQRIAALGGKP